MDGLTCSICEKAVTDENGDGHFAIIARGYYNTADDGRADDSGLYCERIKYSRVLCHECYLNDPDFCRFMNAKGWRIR